MRTVIILQTEEPLDVAHLGTLAREAGFFIAENYEIPVTYSVETIEN